MSTPAGATISQMALATGWQRHSVRGVISGVLRKKFGLKITRGTAETRDLAPYRVTGSGAR